MTVALTPTQAGALSNTATVATTTFDPSLANNTATATAQINHSPDQQDARRSHGAGRIALNGIGTFLASGNTSLDGGATIIDEATGAPAALILDPAQHSIALAPESDGTVGTGALEAGGFQVVSGPLTIATRGVTDPVAGLVGVAPGHGHPEHSAVAVGMELSQCIRERLRGAELGRRRCARRRRARADACRCWQPQRSGGGTGDPRGAINDQRRSGAAEPRDSGHRLGADRRASRLQAGGRCVVGRRWVHGLGFGGLSVNPLVIKGGKLDDIEIHYHAIPPITIVPLPIDLAFDSADVGALNLVNLNYSQPNGALSTQLASIPKCILSRNCTKVPPPLPPPEIVGGVVLSALGGTLIARPTSRT